MINNKEAVQKIKFPVSVEKADVYYYVKDAEDNQLCRTHSEERANLIAEALNSLGAEKDWKTDRDNWVEMWRKACERIKSYYPVVSKERKITLENLRLRGQIDKLKSELRELKNPSPSPSIPEVGDYKFLLKSAQESNLVEQSQKLPQEVSGDSAEALAAFPQGTWSDEQIALGVEMFNKGRATSRQPSEENLLISEKLGNISRSPSEEEIEQLLIEGMFTYEGWLNENQSASMELREERQAATAKFLLKALSRPSKEPGISASEMHLNMQYYMEYCQSVGYVTPEDWLTKHKHF